MEITKLVLEFLKVLLSAPVIAGTVAVVFITVFRSDIGALMGRVARIRFPGGELSTSQAERSGEAPPTEAAPPKVPPGEEVPLPQNIALMPEQVTQLAEIFRAERARAYLWEYRYLNYFLVPLTQRVLDWLASLKDRMTYTLYDSFLTQAVPRAEERKAVIDALAAHHLIQLNGDIIEVTPKGREYVQWRGPLPSIAS
ncbi:MAG: hypothetical protein WEB58_13350 [Planctomycetaceae bacterium]